MTWQFNPYAIPLFISTIPLIVIISAAWRRRSNPSARMFLGFATGAVGLVLAYGLELLSADIGSIRFWLNFEYLSHSALVFWPLFALAYSGYEEAITRRRVLALFILPVIVLILIWTNESHGLIYTSVGVQTVGSVVLFDRTYGIIFWIWLGYLTALFGAGYIILLGKAIRSPGFFRGQIGWLALALFLPALGLFLTQIELTPIPLLDLTPYGIALACIPLAISLFRYRLFQLIPAAYEQVIESMDDAVLVCDDHYRIVQSNSAAAQLTSRTASQILSHSVREVLSETADLKLEQHLFEGSGIHEVIIGQSGANKRYFDLRVSPLRDRRGVVTGKVFVLRDITERKRAEQQALDLAVERERVQVLKSFIQDTSHDFRTPISVILTSAYLLDRLGASANKQIAAFHQSSAEHLNISLLDMTDTLSKMREKTQSIHISAMRLEKLVQSMLDVTQLERSTQFEFELHDLNPLVDECVQAYHAVASQKQLKLEFEPDSALPQTRVDKRQLRHTIRQLVDNAIHYTPRGGAVRINTYQKAGEAVIQIKDTGIGINDTDLPRIFDQFYRADRARSDSTGGAGLGLSIAKRIVEAHAGRIEVESVVEQGSAFRIYLPLNPEISSND